jgi:hypothetical protein
MNTQNSATILGQIAFQDHGVNQYVSHNFPYLPSFSHNFPYLPSFSHFPIIFQSFSHHFPIIFPSFSHHFPSFPIIFPSFSHEIPRLLAQLSAIKWPAIGQAAGSEGTTQTLGCGVAARLESITELMGIEQLDTYMYIYIIYIYMEYIYVYIYGIYIYIGYY